MTIKNVQRVYLGGGVSSFSFDSSTSRDSASLAESTVISGQTVSSPETSNWAELEKRTLETLRRQKIGFSAGKTTI
jgi:hypothetical protein